MSRQIEICCGSYYDALQASLGGAKRIELNSALHLGGLTPSVGMLRLTKKHTKVKVMTMIRCRGAGFCFNKADYETMLEDAKVLLEEGTDGLVYGFLDEYANIDIERTREFTQLAKSYGKEAVFHRAFDSTKDPYQAIEQLIEIGVDRILTSGQQAKAFEGKDLLKDLQLKYGDKIQILAGSGLHAHNVQDFIHATNIQQVHSSCKNWMIDTTTTMKAIDFGYAQGEQHACYEVVDKDLVKKFISKVKEL